MKQATRALRLAADRMAISARGSPGASGTVSAAGACGTASCRTACCRTVMSVSNWRAAEMADDRKLASDGAADDNAARGGAAASCRNALSTKKHHHPHIVEYQ